jgi:predicted phage-related endonuclease
MKNYISKLFNKREIIRTNDLIPTGIKSTVKSSEHGTINDYNQSWKYIHSQIRNFDKFKEEYNIVIK